MFEPATASYPRDLVGYSNKPPHANWPNNARLALQLVLNFEEGGENCILHGDAGSEAFLSEIVGAQGWPGQRHMNMESIYEYGSRAGFWRLHKLFTDQKLPVTVFGVATALLRNPDAVAAMKEANWEIATHGFKWIDYKDFTKADEDQHIAEAIRIHKEVTGQRPLGIYQGRTSINTLDLTMSDGGFLYSSDSYADDLPYWIKGPHGPHLIVPYTLDNNDMRFATPQGFNAGDQFFNYLKDSFDQLYAEGASNPKMMSVGLHCRLVGRPGRIVALQRFLDHVQQHKQVWITTRLDVARHWIQQHPPTGGYKPGEMSEALFVERFGDTFEHTPEIAAMTHAKMNHASGLDLHTNDPTELHRAMVGQMRTLGTEKKLALIRAHPDLAGKLAFASKVTKDSAKEQVSAGLNSLNPTELKRFTILNDAYRKRFGFPFILAVKGRNKEDIIASFEERMGNTPEQEFIRALSEIEHIALLRLQDRMTLGGKS